MALSNAQRRNIRYTAFALAGVVALMVSMFVRQFINPAQLDAGWLSIRGAVIFDAPRTLTTPALLDLEAQPFNGSAFRGRWSVVYFGFTYCPDVCPTTLALLRQVEDSLQPPGGRRLPVSFYLATVDPARDTPGQFAGFVTPPFEVAKLKALLEVLRTRP